MERRHRVWALDDSELIHAKLRLLFRAQPQVELTCTAKWTDVVAICRSESPPDLLILDLDMPDVRGELVGLRVRNDVRTMPIVIFSSESEGRIRVAVASTGARAAIAKTDGEGLVRAVMAILEQAC